MSDDLISRKAVLKELRKIMDEPHNTMFLMGIGAAVSIVEHRETVFDKEKVIDELKRMEEESCKEWNEYGDAASLGKVITFAETIEIVEKGGIE